MHPAPARRWSVFIRVGVVVSILAALTAVSAEPLLQSGWFMTHERLDPVQRLLALAYEIRSGDLYPRWLSAAYQGKGSPFFEFYAPAYYLASAYLYGAGVPLAASLKTVLVLQAFLGALGVHVWCRRHLGDRAALLAAALYLFAPYHFVDLYVRGALAEFAALSVLPWLFAAIDLAIAQPFSPRALASMAVASAGVVLTHNLTAVMIAGFAAAYAVAHALARDSSARAVRSVMTGALLGAALSAFFWLPMLVGLRSIHDLGNTLLSDYYQYTNHFVFPHQWFDSTWGFGGSFPGPQDGMSFQVGTPALVAAAIALAIAPWLPSAARRMVLLSAVLAGMALWLTCSASAWLYELVPPFRMIQFPWRFLGPASLFLAALGGGAASFTGARRSWIGWGLALGFSVLVVANTSDQRQFSQQLPISDDREVQRRAAEEGYLGRFTQLHEYLPRWTDFEQADAPPGPATAKSGGTVQTIEIDADRRLLLVRAPASGTDLEVPCFYFPGWRAVIDGHPSPVLPGRGGFLTVAVPPGDHWVEVSFGTTLPRVVGWLVAGLACAGLLWLFARECHRGSGAGKRARFEDDDLLGSSSSRVA